MAPLASGHDADWLPVRELPGGGGAQPHRRPQRCRGEHSDCDSAACRANERYSDGPAAHSDAGASPVAPPPPRPPPPPPPPPRPPPPPPPRRTVPRARPSAGARRSFGTRTYSHVVARSCRALPGIGHLALAHARQTGDDQTCVCALRADGRPPAGRFSRTTAVRLRPRRSTRPVLKLDPSPRARESTSAG